MIKVEQFIKDLKHLALNRTTYYCNYFPANCGEINADGSISFDCIGLVKSYINEPSIAYKTSPKGYYVRPAQVIPDTTEIGILNLCTNVHWGDFSNVVPGSYMYMTGHAGVFMGEFEDYKMGGIVNCVECTTGIEPKGVVTSYVDAYGNRFSSKGGYQVGKWEAWGQLTPYIDYSKPQPEPTKSVDEVAKEVIQGKWGNDPERKQKLIEKYGEDFRNKVQARVDELMKPSDDIKVGDKVKVINAIQYGNGLPFTSYFDVYEVMEVVDDRVVIGVNGVVTSAINKSNLKKA